MTTTTPQSTGKPASFFARAAARFIPQHAAAPAATLPPPAAPQAAATVPNIFERATALLAQRRAAGHATPANAAPAPSDAARSSLTSSPLLTRHRAAADPVERCALAAEIIAQRDGHAAPQAAAVDAETLLAHYRAATDPAEKSALAAQLIAQRDGFHGAN